MRLKLKVKSPSQEWVAEFIEATQVLVGRTKAQVVLDDERCSRAHCLFVEGGQGELHLRDLDSSNGTFFRDKKINETEVKVGDVIRIGRTNLQVVEFEPETKKSSVADSEVITDWSNMLRSMPAEKVENFLDYLDESQKKKSLRLQDLMKKKKKAAR